MSKKKDISRDLVKARNKKVSTLRGSAWCQKLVIGKNEAKLNPSRLAAARISRGLSQKALGAKVGLTSATLGGIERGNRLVKESHAKLLAKELTLPIHKLFETTTTAKTKTKRFVAVVQKHW